VNSANFDRWAKLWAQVSAAGDAQGAYEHLVALYSQPHRHYHNLRHIAECLAEFDSARHLVDAPLSVEIAIWFHDAIYDTHAQDNEERSADLASRRILEAGGRPDLAKAVVGLILATKAHDPALSQDAALLVDVDLSILGQPGARFHEYELQIRREYDWVPEETFAMKRAEVLKRFIVRERIYTTDSFHAKYERQARFNLENSIRALDLLAQAG
jgi:predicted metal-dependent HD superfamily phosphohydrolase